MTGILPLTWRNVHAPPGPYPRTRAPEPRAPRVPDRRHWGVREREVRSEVVISPGWVAGSAAGDVGDDDVGGVAVEVLAASVVDGGGSRVGVTGGDLDVSERYPCVEGGHDEC